MRIIFTLLILVFSVSSLTHAEWDDGMPFGKVSDQDVTDLFKFAQSKNLDLKSAVDKIYANDSKAFNDVFLFARQLSTLDKNARTYGQIVYSSLLNISEQIGIDRYSEIVDSQPADVKQRVRDFLYYVVYTAPLEKRKEVESEARKGSPKLFPPSYEFGKNDPIFDGYKNDMPKQRIRFGISR